jgi:hypothetical protein
MIRTLRLGCLLGGFGGRQNEAIEVAREVGVVGRVVGVLAGFLGG